METKTCKTCGIEKPLTDFSPSASGKQGRAAHCKVCKAARDRETYRQNTEQIRARKRVDMRKRRADPEINAGINERRRVLYPTKSKQGQQVYLADLRKNHFFIWRARIWSARHKERVTALELFALWRRQHGRCPLSGRKLNGNAHLDHIIPSSKDGKHGIENLRWIDPVVNVARGNMSDGEFIAMCLEICNWQSSSLVTDQGQA